MINNKKIDLNTLKNHTDNHYLSVDKAKELYMQGKTCRSSYIFKLKNGEQIFFFGKRYNADKYVKTGIFEKEDAFSWSNGKKLNIKIRFPEWQAGSNIQACFNLMYVFTGAQSISVKVNNAIVYKGKINQGKDLVFNFTLHEDKIADIIIALPDACSPKDLGQSEDSRILALAIKTAIFKIL